MGWSRARAYIRATNAENEFAGRAPWSPFSNFVQINILKIQTIPK
jgi:hypothetical protein